MPTTKFAVRVSDHRGPKVKAEYASQAAADAASKAIREAGKWSDVQAVRVPDASVCVTRCGHCTLEVYGYAPETGECPRCGRPESYRHSRWISDPPAETTARAKRNAAE